MRRWALTWLGAAIVGVACASQPAPRILIVQPKVPVVQTGANAQPDPNLPIAEFLAEELDQDGRVSPVVWSMSDPVFRSWVEERRIPAFLENPTDRQIREVVGTLRIPYLLVMGAARDEEGFAARAKLFRGTSTRSIWSFGDVDDRGEEVEVIVYEGGIPDPNARPGTTPQPVRKRVQRPPDRKSFMVSVDGAMDWVSTSHSIARTWARLLHAGPLKDLTPRPRPQVEEEEPLAGALTMASQPIEPASGSVAASLQQAQQMVTNGKKLEAVLLLRDAVDSHPQDPEPRAALAQLLVDLDMPREAAEQAGQAGQMSGRPELLLLSARAWLDVAEVERAQTRLNEALARGARGGQVDLVRADVYLARGRYQDAVEAYSLAMQSLEEREPRLGRALAYALLGDVASCNRELEQLATAGGAADERLYVRAIRLVGSALPGIVDQLRRLPQELRMSPRDPELTRQATAAQGRLAAISTFIAMVPVPERYQRSHQVRNLAHKLLHQSASEALAFARSGEDDLGFESSITLGEALRLFDTAHEHYDIERRYEPSERRGE